MKNDKQIYILILHHHHFESDGGVKRDKKNLKIYLK